MFSIENLRATYIQKIKNSDNIMDKVTGVAEISGKGVVAGATTILRHAPKMIAEQITQENLKRANLQKRVSHYQQALKRDDLDSDQRAQFEEGLAMCKTELRQINQERQEREREQYFAEQQEITDRVLHGEKREDIQKDIEERKASENSGWFPALSSNKRAEAELRNMRKQVGELEIKIEEQKSHISELQSEHETLVQNHELSKTIPDNEEETTTLYYKIEEKAKEIEQAIKQLEKLKKTIINLRERIGIYVARRVQETM